MSLRARCWWGEAEADSWTPAPRLLKSYLETWAREAPALGLVF